MPLPLYLNYFVPYVTSISAGWERVALFYSLDHLRSVSGRDTPFFLIFPLQAAFVELTQVNLARSYPFPRTLHDLTFELSFIEVIRLYEIPVSTRSHDTRHPQFLTHSNSIMIITLSKHPTLLTVLHMHIHSFTIRLY